MDKQLLKGNVALAEEMVAHNYFARSFDQSMMEMMDRSKHDRLFLDMPKIVAFSD